MPIPTEVLAECWATYKLYFVFSAAWAVWVSWALRERAAKPHEPWTTPLLLVLLKADWELVRSLDAYASHGEAASEEIWLPWLAAASGFLAAVLATSVCAVCVAAANARSRHKLSFDPSFSLGAKFGLLCVCLNWLVLWALNVAVWAEGFGRTSAP